MEDYKAVEETASSLSPRFAASPGLDKLEEGAVLLRAPFAVPVVIPLPTSPTPSDEGEGLSSLSLASSSSLSSVDPRDRGCERRVALVQLSPTLCVSIGSEGQFLRHQAREPVRIAIRGPAIRSWSVPVAPHSLISPVEDQRALHQACRFFFNLMGDEFLWRVWLQAQSTHLSFNGSWRSSARKSDSPQGAHRQFGIAGKKRKRASPSNLGNRMDPSSSRACGSEPFSIENAACRQLLASIFGDGESCEGPRLVEKMDLQGLRLGSFMRKHVRGSRPVVLRADSPWNLFDREHWDPQILFERYRLRCFTVTSHKVGLQNEMKLHDFFEYMGVCGSDEGFDPLYLFDHEVPEALRKSIHAPDILGEVDVLDIAERDGDLSCLPPALRKAQYMLLGGHGSGMGFHVDPYGVSAFSMLATGRKLWALSPPDKLPPYVRLIRTPPENSAQTILYEAPTSQTWFHKRFIVEKNKFAHAGKRGGPGKTKIDPCVYILQEPGDVVFVPAGWWHCVLNLDAGTLAYTQNLLTRNNVRRMAAQLSSDAPKFSRYLKKEHCRAPKLDED
eukprot:CAMPEP_0114531292 /NCGR_PEP_ID=MMETSP0109-20121206/25976_1 /TAXON_ID=29199 /ORGANISM="Chlorarachnion reptans, Strain CCCM449" /LENGTH=558 /DNA_ID=CAMNT_0001714123 /DNA_START=106 /DNA_END=1783 /DNA_ORIENTATION=-